VDFTRPSRAVKLSLVSGAGHYDTVIEAVRRARVSVWIATANLKELMVADGHRRRYRSVLGVLDELASVGVELRILHASMPSRAFRRAFDGHPRLIAGGLELRACPRVHLKAIIVDGARMYLGSANWTGAGLGAKGPHRRNFEVGIVTDDAAMIDDVQALYDSIWRGETCGACRLRDRCDAPLDL
jgi:phosphatidylserine/phosphatidylglycerophosphate/cardiolipin synthase-like enzyme